MAKMHELLAVLNDRSSAATAIINETKDTFGKRADHFKGQTRVVTFFDEARASENVSDTKEIVTTVDDKLDHALKIVGHHWDALFQMEATNQVANADLIVDGVKIAEGVPATFLLGMEARLKELRGVLLMMPTLAPELTWSENASLGKGVFVSNIQTNFKTEKNLGYKVLYEATKEHPAQIREWTEDKPVAKIETTQRSAMLSPARKSAMIERTDELIAAVKKARQRANTVDVIGKKIAKDMFDYIRG